jgi:diguanylate cyclase (GGDEF)-like protein/PAS domain S-box-containing protein
VARAEGILRLLIVDDSLSDADAVINSIRSAGHAVRANRAENLDDVETELRMHMFDMLVCRDKLAAVSAHDVITLVQNLAKDIPAIVIADAQEKIDALYSIGAKDIVLKQDVKRLQFAVERELGNLFIRRLARRNERALRESEKRSHALLESSRDAVAYMHEGMHIYVNTAYLELFGYEETEDIDGLPFLDMISSSDHRKFKAVFRQFSEQSDVKSQKLSVKCVKADGSQFKASIEFGHAQVEGENCTQVVVRDEAALLNASSQNELLKDRDFVTGLFNKAKFLDELEKCIDKAVDGSDAELLYIALDDFQEIKEEIGLGNTDIVLKGVGDLLRKHAANDEVLGYYSDRVFTVIIPSNSDKKVDARAETFRKLIEDFAANIQGNVIDLKCSIGISRISESLSSAVTTLENANRACITAQRAGGNQIGRFQAVIEQELEQANSLSTDDWKSKLMSAINNDEFALNFQPIISLHGDDREIYEVLLRLDACQGDGKAFNADEFITQAKTIGMMPDIDKWVTRHALTTLAEHRQAHPKTRFFIKLSEETIKSQDYVNWLKATLSVHDLAGNVLTFEISETAAIQNMDTVKEVINQLKSIGCEFGLEHFGSGIDFSQSLTELDIDYVKINGNFVQNMARDAENQAAVKAIIEMSREAGKKCIAEFVSDANSLALLWRLGVDYAQGFYIHEPSDKLDYNFEDDDM